jgi:hypothetical protein
MDTARQVVRWSIPGWVFLFVLALLQATTWFVEGNSPSSILQAEAPLLTPAAIAAVVTAGVPLGFILYQIYYSWYGKVLPFGFVNRDRGADILLALSPEVRNTLCSIDGTMPDLEEMSDPVRSFLLPYPFRRLKRVYRNALGAARFEAKAHDNWDLIRFWLHRVSLINKAELLKSEVTTLADIYHAVGAARTALLLSCVLHLLFNMKLVFNITITHTVSMPILHAGAAILGPYILALWLFRVFERTRASALNSLLSILILTFKTFPLQIAVDLNAH